MSDVPELLRQWIVDVLKAHAGVMAIALPQRAKFEGWLRFELVAHAELMGATSVTVEAPSPGGRSDLLFEGHGVHYDIELKTPNTFHAAIPGGGSRITWRWCVRAASQPYYPSGVPRRAAQLDVRRPSSDSHRSMLL